MANTADDFLSFKEYPMTHDEMSGNAKINVNSPIRSQNVTQNGKNNSRFTTLKMIQSLILS